MNMEENINKIQEKIMEFAEKRARIKNYKLDLETSLIHIMEELGETSSQLFNKKARHEKFDTEKLNDGVCDILLESMIFAKLLDFDLAKELNKKIEELNNRKL